MNRCVLVAFLVIGGFVIGCLPEKKIVWSRDGKQAVVMSADHTFLIDGSGKILGKQKLRLSGASWYPDNDNLAWIEVRELSTWVDVASMMTPQRREQTIGQSETLFKDMMAYKGEWKDFKPSIDVKDFASALLYMRQQHSKELQSKANLPKELIGVTKSLYQITVCMSASIGHALPGSHPCYLDYSLDALSNLVVSPNGKAVAYIAHREETTELCVAGAGKEPLTIEKNVAPNFGWTADGCSLVYAVQKSKLSAQGGDDIDIGWIVRTAVLDKEGKPLKERQSEKLALVEMNADTLISSAVPNSILFTSRPITVPAKPDAGKEPRRLYLLNTQDKDAQIKPVEGVPDSPVCFSASPDGKLVAVLGEKGRVTVIEIATGKVCVGQKDTIEDQSLILWPAWKSNTELSFVVPAGASFGSPKRAELVIWTHGAPGKPIRPISRDWPDELVKGLLISNKPTTAPASHPVYERAKPPDPPDQHPTQK